MAANHVAIMRGSARIAHHSNKEDTDPSCQGDKNDDNIPTSQPDEVEQSVNELSQMSVISISSGEDAAELAHELSFRQLSAPMSHHGSPSTSASATKTVAPPKPLMAPIEQLNTIADLESCVDPDLSQLNVLNKLEEKWNIISNNFQTALQHLKECSDQVTEASLACSQSLTDSIELTCDKVDVEMKALYQLIAKCDELVTKLSVAGSFREEIKTLKKSIETLEQLYKTRPQNTP